MPDENPKKITAKDIMTQNVISVGPEMTIIEAAKIIADHNFDGIPVVDNQNKLLGIITQYDLIAKTSELNVSLLQKVLDDLRAAKNESEARAEKNITELTVKDVMNSQPLTLTEHATFEEIIAAFKNHHRVNPILIVNEDNQIAGVVSRFDVLRPLNFLNVDRK